MKTIHAPAPRPDYESAAYLIFCFAVTAAWVCGLVYVGRRFLESLPL